MPLDDDIAALLASLAKTNASALSDETPEHEGRNYDAAVSAPFDDCYDGVVHGFVGRWHLRTRE
jgi:hypothetical protein